MYIVPVNLRGGYPDVEIGPIWVVKKKLLYIRCTCEKI